MKLRRKKRRQRVSQAARVKVSAVLRGWHRRDPSRRLANRGTPFAEGGHTKDDGANRWMAVASSVPSRRFGPRHRAVVGDVHPRVRAGGAVEKSRSKRLNGLSRFSGRRGFLLRFPPASPVPPDFSPDIVTGHLDRGFRDTNCRWPCFPEVPEAWGQGRPRRRTIRNEPIQGLGESSGIVLDP